jgi:putative oxidoreductase
MNTLLALPRSITLLRIGIALLMIPHGIGKVVSFTDYTARLPAWAVALSIAAELGCSLVLLSGRFTRWALLPLIVNMVVAAFVIKLQAPWANKELAVLYLLVYVVILLDSFQHSHATRTGS